MSCNKESKNNFNIDVNITNFVLTPLTCSSLISRIIKCLIYEKSQIPYPYEWLRTIVDKKRKQDDGTDSESSMSPNHQAARHFRVVANAYDSTEALINNIRKQFKSGNNVEEILLIFGGSELSPKEVYRIKIPVLSTGHFESNHLTTNDKLSRTVLRKILLSQEWLSAVDHTLSPTNMFIFLKTNGGEAENLESFVPNSSFYFPKNALVMTINLNYQDTFSHNCCSNLTVFEDVLREESAINESEIHKQKCVSDDENTENEWYQANVVLKGFKEGFVNKVPLSQLW